MPRFTDKQAIKALTDARGLVSVAAKRLDCSRQALYQRIKNNPRIAEAKDDAREMTGDLAEAKLIEAINDGQAWAIKYFLTCQMKHRGYVERTEVQSDVMVAGTLDVNVDDAREELRRRLTAVADRIGSPGGNGRRL